MFEFDESQRTKTKSAPHVAWTEDEIETGRGLALLSYLPGLCFLGLIQGSENRFIAHHARQGFILFVLELAALIFRWNLLWDALIIFCIILGLIGMAYAFTGRSFRVPFIADWFGGIRG